MSQRNEKLRVVPTGPVHVYSHSHLNILGIVDKCRIKSNICCITYGLVLIVSPALFKIAM